MTAKALPDHRLVYLDYEGPIAGGRGSVSRWDEGTYEFQQQGEESFTIELSGGKYRGRVSFQRLPGEDQQRRICFA